MELPPDLRDRFVKRFPGNPLPVFQHRSVIDVFQVYVQLPWPEFHFAHPSERDNTVAILDFCDSPGARVLIQALANHLGLPVEIVFAILIIIGCDTKQLDKTHWATPVTGQMLNVPWWLRAFSTVVFGFLPKLPAGSDEEAICLRLEIPNFFISKLLEPLQMLVREKRPTVLPVPKCLQNNHPVLGRESTFNCYFLEAKLASDWMGRAGFTCTHASAKSHHSCQDCMGCTCSMIPFPVNGQPRTQTDYISKVTAAAHMNDTVQDEDSHVRLLRHFAFKDSLFFDVFRDAMHCILHFLKQGLGKSIAYKALRVVSHYAPNREKQRTVENLSRKMDEYVSAAPVIDHTAHLTHGVSKFLGNKKREGLSLPGSLLNDIVGWMPFALVDAELGENLALKYVAEGGQGGRGGREGRG